MRRRRWTAAALVSAAVVACGELLSDPSPAVVAGDGGDPVVEDGDGGRCVCLAPVPAGWAGPEVFDELVDCAPPWEVEVGRLHAGLDAGSHDCACSCAAPGATCVVKQDNAATGCNNALCSSYASAAGVCVTLGASCNAMVRVTLDAGGGPCAPDAGQRTESPGWIRSARRCATTRPILAGRCPSPADLCAPEHGATSAHCITHDGDVPCPPSYPNGRSYYAGFSDTRTCSACSCMNGAPACELGLFTDVGCATPAGTSAVGACSGIAPTITHVKVLRSATSCTPSGGAPNGGVTPTGPATVCCR